jgi:hypothetical protein
MVVVVAPAGKYSTGVGEAIEGLARMPLPLGPRPKPAGSLSPDLCREHRPEPVPTDPHRFVAHVDTALLEQVFEIAKRQRAPDIHHHRKADHLRRCLEIAEWISHPKTLRNRPAQLKPVSSDNPHWHHPADVAKA